MSVLLRVGMGMALVVAVLAGAASPANAHAVLLRTEPSPQATLSEPPPEIRFEFSEPVEVAFGAVRLFDVDGQRVRTGAIGLADDDRTVILPVSALSDGTYTVTWRVASADGHPVSGGFVFYVGAPSAISPVPVDAEQSQSATTSWVYGGVRFVWFSAVVALIGLVVARRRVWTPAVRATGLDGSPAAARFRRDFRVLLPAVWVALAVAGAMWLVFEASALSGFSLMSSLSPDVLGELMSTTFGRWWVAGLALTLLLLVPIVALTRRRPLWGISPTVWIGVLGVLVTGVAVASAMTGHARSDRMPGLTVPSIVVHLLAAGVWVGGLGALVLLGGHAWRATPADHRAPLLRELIVRFGRLAVAAVIAVVVTGVINGLANVGPIPDLWATAYGRVLTAKVVLVAVALAMAARHRWVVPGELSRRSEEFRTAAVVSFQRTSFVETAVLASTLALAAALVALVPGRTAALAGQGPVNEEKRLGQYTVQVAIDPSEVGQNEIHVTFVDSSGVAAGDVTNAEVALGRGQARAEPLPARLIGPGHFVAEATMPEPGRYHVMIRVGSPPSGPEAHFPFELSAGDRSRR